MALEGFTIGGTSSAPAGGSTPAPAPSSGGSSALSGFTIGGKAKTTTAPTSTVTPPPEKLPGIDTPFTPDQQEQFGTVPIPKGSKAGDKFTAPNGRTYTVQGPSLEDIGHALYSQGGNDKFDPLDAIGNSDTQTTTTKANLTAPEESPIPTLDELQNRKEVLSQGKPDARPADTFLSKSGRAVLATLNLSSLDNEFGISTDQRKSDSNWTTQDQVRLQGSIETTKEMKDHPALIDPMVYLARGIGFGHDPVNDIENAYRGYQANTTLSDMPEPTTIAQNSAQAIGNLLTLTVAQPAIEEAVTGLLGQTAVGSKVLQGLKIATEESPWKIGYSTKVAKAIGMGGLFGAITKNKNSLAKNVIDTAGMFGAFEALAYPILTFFKPILESVGKMDIVDQSTKNIIGNPEIQNPVSKTIYFKNPSDPTQILKVTAHGVDFTDADAEGLVTGQTKSMPTLTKLEIEAFQQNPSLFENLKQWLSGSKPEESSINFESEDVAPGETVPQKSAEDMSDEDIQSGIEKVQEEIKNNPAPVKSERQSVSEKMAAAAAEMNKNIRPAFDGAKQNKVLEAKGEKNGLPLDMKVSRGQDIVNKISDGQVKLTLMENEPSPNKFGEYIPARGNKQAEIRVVASNGNIPSKALFDEISHYHLEGMSSAEREQIFNKIKDHPETLASREQSLKDGYHPDLVDEEYATNNLANGLHLSEFPEQKRSIIQKSLDAKRAAIREATGLQKIHDAIAEKISSKPKAEVKTEPVKAGSIPELEKSLKEKYAATGPSEVEGFTKADEKLSEITTELELSKPGERIMVNGKMQGVSSTFPSWVPEGLRSSDLFKKVFGGLDSVEKISYPSGNRPAQRALYDAILGELDDRLGIDTSDIRGKIITTHENNLKGKNAEPSDKGTGGGKGGRTEKTGREEQIDVPDITGIKTPEEYMPRETSIQLNVELIPGLSKLISDDIIPKSKGLAGGIKQAFHEVATFLNPAGYVPKKALDIIMVRKGEFEKNVFKMEQATKEIKKMWDKQPEKARLQFMSDVEAGREVSPEFKELASFYKTRLENAYKAIGKFKSINFVENFFPHFWKKPGEIEKDFLPKFAKRPLQGSRSFLKKRIFETIQDGIEAGYKPVSTNPEELMQVYETNVQKFLMAQKMKQDLIDRGFWQFVKTGDKAPEGFTRINDAVARVYYKQTTTLKEFYDERIMRSLEGTAARLGINLERVLKDKGMPKNAVGVSYRNQNLIKTRFASPEDVLMHEIGHQIDDRYGMQKMFLNDPVIDKELDKLADKRMEGFETLTSEKDKAYLRSGPEKMAVMFQSYLHTPDMFKSVAPKAYNLFRTFLSMHPELKPILNIRPSLLIGSSQQVLDGPLLQAGEYYAQQDVARLINNHLSKDYILDTALGRGAMAIKNTMNALELGFSAFHITGEAINSIVSKVGVGLNQVSQGNILRGLADLAKAPLTPVSYYRTGQKFFNGDPQLKVIEDALFAGGASFREKAYYKNTVLDNFLKNIREGNFGGALLRAPMAAVEGTMRPIFAHIIPRLKVGAFRDLFATELERNSAKIQAGQITQEEIARGVWNSIENRYGELNYDNLFWDKNLKTAAMLTFRAVGWNLGTIRELGGAFMVDLPKSTFNAVRGKGFQFTSKMQYTLGLFFTVAVMGAIYQYLHTGKMPQSPLDLFYPHNGAKNAQGEDQRVEMPTYLKDLYQYAHDPIGTFGNKTSPLFDTIIDLMTNKDFYGDFIRNTNDNLPLQAKEVALYLLGQFEPFTFANIQQQLKGTTPLEQRIESLFGIINAPREATQTAYEKALQQAFVNQQGASGPQTPEEKQAQQMKAQARQEIQNGNYDTLNQLVQEGLISQTQADTFIKESSLTTDQRMYNSLSNKNKQAIDTQFGAPAGSANAAYQKAFNTWTADNTQKDAAFKQLVQDLYGSNPKTGQINIAKKNFAIYRQYGMDNKYVNAIVGTNSTDAKVAILQQAQATMTPEDFQTFYNTGRKTVTLVSGNSSPILISDPLDQKFKEAPKLPAQASDQNAPVFKDGQKTTQSSIIDNVLTYARAIGTDPATAFNRIFTGQHIRAVENGAVIVDRMSFQDSTAEKKSQSEADNLPFTGMRLDHTVPLEIGGSNSKDNLKLVTEAEWASYTPIENYLGTQLKAGTITKSDAQDLIVKFKKGTITAQDVYNFKTK